jgi:hypothetical protein
MARVRSLAQRNDMDNLAVLTPSFRGDASLFVDLHRLVLANIARSVVHHVVVPPSDAPLLREYEGARCRVWTHRACSPVTACRYHTHLD